ncbi:MAG: tetratricopeptide repeat protein [Chloroflexi bacterium]|nr:tetratricopeptide repeat protein [Chloroflexota bacterium]
MTNQTTDDRARMVRRQRQERAIKLAMESKWEEAAQENEIILQAFPKDVDAHNRLGKALTELGRYADARAAYGRALQLDANNAIARKNLQRLEALGQAAPPPAETRQKVDPDLFIEETGKTGVTTLVRPTRDLLKLMTAGDKIGLRRQGSGLMVETGTGEFLGLIEPRLALRLTRLMETGNEYAAAIASVSPAGDAGRVIIKEIRQSPENVGRLSFPTTGEGGVRPYTKETLLRYDPEDEESDDQDGDGNEDWEGDTETESGPEVRFSEYERATETDDSDTEFEE